MSTVLIIMPGPFFEDSSAEKILTSKINVIEGILSGQETMEKKTDKLEALIKNLSARYTNVEEEDLRSKIYALVLEKKLRDESQVPISP